MPSPRQFARAQICKTVDEMIAELHKIQRHALHMDDFAIMAIGKSFATRFNHLITIYQNLGQVNLPPEKKILVPDKFELG